MIKLCKNCGKKFETTLCKKIKYCSEDCVVDGSRYMNNANRRKWRKNNLDRDRMSAKNRRDKPENKYKIYQRSAKERGLLFGISFEEFNEITKAACNYCGEAGGGIDRIDSTMGYIKNNVTSCCTSCNLMKSDCTVSEFITHCIKVAQNYTNH